MKNFCPYCPKEVMKDINDHIKLRHMHWEKAGIQPYRQMNEGIDVFKGEFEIMTRWMTGFL